MITTAFRKIHLKNVFLYCDFGQVFFHTDSFIFLVAYNQFDVLSLAIFPFLHQTIRGIEFYMIVYSGGGHGIFSCFRLKKKAPV